MSTEIKEKPADLGFDDVFNDLDINTWTPNTPKNDVKPDKKVVKKVAEKAGFSSREPDAKIEEEPETQINIKAKKSAIDTFRELCKTQSPKWPQGYAFEKAVAALKRELEHQG